MSYDLSCLHGAINNFYRISGMEIAVGDADRRGITSARCEGCNFCSYVHSYPHAIEICSASDIEHIQLMEKSREPIIYTCPLGIEEILLPIMREGELDGYLFCSMGILDEGDGADGRVLELCRTVLGRADGELSRKIAEMPHFTPAERDAYVGILMALGRYIETERLLPDKKQTVGQLVKSYVKENLKRKITLSDIAWNLRCSTVTVTEHFRREMGISVMQYVMKKRMERAGNIMKSGRLSVADAAREVGFSDVEYFSRCFKSYWGASPREWRRRHLDG